ncbi:MAG: amidohydrolase [Flavobacteriales bacterium CG_4_10_14_0_2_um_filter_32_8]|nr:MAG: amidohydrolase [Flavobacteriales bacterium CG_4_10_14_0_2_um_filter_32_8]PJB15251.1 MAG: amidohydrolase [Flavobacteriales bacterium CG_4_9_14_3_um_filter_32_8]
MKNILLIILTNLVLGLAAQVEIPAPKQTKKILLLNGTAHVGNGKIIENAAIAFEEGKLTMVDDATRIKIEFDHFDTIINIRDQHVYPGIIAPNSTLGITEIDAVRATNDFDEIGEFTPHVRSIIAYSTDSKITPTIRSNGVLMAQITPRGGVISGTSSIVQFDAWNWEDAIYKEDDGVHLNWSRMFSRWNGEKSKNYEKSILALNSFFGDALAYSKVNTHDEKNLRFESMRGIFDGNKTLFIHTDFVKEITEAINFSKKYSVKKMVIVGGYDAWMIADMLKENNIAVMLCRLHDLPQRQEDDVYLPYKLPKLLFDAGVLFCLENAGDMEAMNTRNLPFYAGTAAAYGINKEDALSLITLNTAKILGIDKTVGSLEVGKDATLFISTGDALDMKSNDVTAAYIQGRALNLNNFQKKLYEKYSEKYKGQ